MNEEASEEEQESSKSDKLEFDEQAFEDALGASPMDEDAVQMHELFLSFMRAGFLEHQALRLVAMLIDQANAETIVFTADDGDDDEGDD